MDTCKLVFGHDDLVINVVASIIGHLSPEDYKPCTAIGIAVGNKMVGGAIYNNYHGFDIQITVACHDKRWATRANLRTLLFYPFVQLGCVRTTLITSKKNKYVRSVVERLGWVMEGRVRRGYDGKEDAIIYGMLKNECKWIK